MMDLQKLYQILEDCTVQLRKGEEVTHECVGALDVTHVYAMPHVDDARADIVTVDCVFLVVGVDKVKAETHRAELIAILNDYPRPDRLKAGPSYIEVGAEIGDQGAAFQLFALGQVLRLWNVMTPLTLGFTDADDVRDMAGRGFVMITGYAPAAEVRS